jgi:hypothetical protein
MAQGPKTFRDRLSALAGRFDGPNDPDAHKWNSVLGKE